MSTTKFHAGRWGFYQPHKPVRSDGTLINHATGEVYTPPSMTKQEFKDQCNINNIIKEFIITGQITHISAKAAQGAFIDLPGSLDYQESLNVMLKAEEAFLALPAKIRDRFGNDPAEFLAFASDPANGDELIELGIRERPLRKATEAATAAAGVTGVSPVANPAPAPGEAPGGSEARPGGQARKP